MNSHQFSYVVISKDNLDERAVYLNSRIFKAWFTEWEKVFSNESRNFKPNPDDFIRQDITAAILQNDEIVGFHFYSFFDIRRKENTLHSYFHQIDELSFERLKKKKLFNIMSMEYLTVSAQFRKKESQIPWGEVLVALGLRVLNSSNGDLAFGTARRDVKVNRMGDRLGFSVLQNPVTKYDYECEVMYRPAGELPQHPDSEVQSLINQLWNGRIDLRSNDEENLIKKTA